jgi:hypothetical protein
MLLFHSHLFVVCFSHQIPTNGLSILRSSLQDANTKFRPHKSRYTRAAEAAAAASENMSSAGSVSGASVRSGLSLGFGGGSVSGGRAGFVSLSAGPISRQAGIVARPPPAQIVLKVIRPPFVAFVISFFSFLCFFLKFCHNVRCLTQGKLSLPVGFGPERHGKSSKANTGADLEDGVSVSSGGGGGGGGQRHGTSKTLVAPTVNLASAGGRRRVGDEKPLATVRERERGVKEGDGAGQGAGDGGDDGDESEDEEEDEDWVEEVAGSRRRDETAEEKKARKLQVDLVLCDLCVTFLSKCILLGGAGEGGAADEAAVKEAARRRLSSRRRAIGQDYWQTAKD